MRTAPLLLALAAGAAIALATAACGSSHTPSTPSSSSASSSAAASPATPASIQVSSDFKPGGAISRVHTCDGQDMSPPLRATGLPAATKEVVIAMVDHDAADFMHWGIAHLTPHATIDLASGAAPPAGAVLGRNGFGSLGYRGPCPPRGDSPHHYEITVYALSRPSRLKPGFSETAATGLPVLASGSLTGLYARR